MVLFAEEGVDMTFRVDYRTSTSSSWKNNIDWNPAKAEGYFAKQWWITGFSPTCANKKLPNSSFLRATYTVKCITKGYSSSFDTALKNSFQSKYVNSMNLWTFNSRVSGILCRTGFAILSEESPHVTASLGNVERNDWTIHGFNGSFLDVSALGWVPLLSGHPIFHGRDSK